MFDAITNEPYWIVVVVHSGIPVEAKVFSTYERASEYSESLRKNLNLDNDETGIFETKLENRTS